MVAGRKKYAKAVPKYFANIKWCCLFSGAQIATDADRLPRCFGFLLFFVLYIFCVLFVMLIAMLLLAEHYGYREARRSTCHERNKM